MSGDINYTFSFYGDDRFMNNLPQNRYFYQNGIIQTKPILQSNASLWGKVKPIFTSERGVNGERLVSNEKTSNENEIYSLFLYGNDCYSNDWICDLKLLKLNINLTLLWDIQIDTNMIL